MIRFKDRLKSLLYRVLRTQIPTDLIDTCNKCKKKRRSLFNLSFKPNHFIGYDKILSEWILFIDYNLYAKVWIMNGYIVNVRELDEKLWQKIKLLCCQCITRHFKENP